MFLVCVLCVLCAFKKRKCANTLDYYTTRCSVKVLITEESKFEVSCKGLCFTTRRNDIYQQIFGNDNEDAYTYNICQKLSKKDLTHKSPQTNISKSPFLFFIFQPLLRTTEDMKIDIKTSGCTKDI